MIYKRRHPEKTEYYRIIEANFEALERNYPELFEEDYGYLRKDIMPAILAIWTVESRRMVWQG